MDTEMFELQTKALLGEPLTDEEKLKVQRRNAKYELVRYLVLEKGGENKGVKMSNFHFTPGENFMETPTIDIVNSILDAQKKAEIKNPFSFNDDYDILYDSENPNNPPRTEKLKQKLID